MTRAGSAIRSPGSHSRALRRVGTTAAVIALLAVGATIVGTAPTDDEVIAPFENVGTVGETVEGRETRVLVTGIRTTTSLTASYAFTALDAPTEGTWVIVDTVITPRVNSVGLSNSELRIGEYLFRATDIQPSPSLLLFPFGPDLPVTGSVIFEIPDFALESADARNATVVYQSRTVSTLDDVPTVRLDLTTAESFDTVELEAARVEDHG